MIYFMVAFLNILVDTSETFGILVLVTFVLLHQFNLLTSIHHSSSLSKLYVLDNQRKNLSITKLYLSTFLLATLSTSSR